MGLDLVMLAWLLITGLLGFRDGAVRKLSSLVLTGVALFAGHQLMRSAGDVFIDTFNVSPSTAPMLGFLSVFIAIVIIQSIAYKLATDSYKIGGIADRSAGAFLGLLQGMLFLSSLLFILSFAGVPSKATTKYSKVYRTVVNIAPQMLDLFTTVQASSLDDFQEKAGQGIKNMMRPGEAAADSLTNNRLLQEVRKRSAETGAQIDSLRAGLRR